MMVLEHPLCVLRREKQEEAQITFRLPLAVIRVMLEDSGIHSP